MSFNYSREDEPRLSATGREGRLLKEMTTTAVMSEDGDLSTKESRNQGHFQHNVAIPTESLHLNNCAAGKVNSEVVPVSGSLEENLHVAGPRRRGRQPKAKLYIAKSGEHGDRENITGSNCTSYRCDRKTTKQDVQLNDSLPGELNSRVISLPSCSPVAMRASGSKRRGGPPKRAIVADNDGLCQVISIEMGGISLQSTHMNSSAGTDGSLLPCSQEHEQVTGSKRRRRPQNSMGEKLPKGEDRRITQRTTGGGGAEDNLQQASLTGCIPVYLHISGPRRRAGAVSNAGGHLENILHLNCLAESQGNAQDISPISPPENVQISHHKRRGRPPKRRDIANGGQEDLKSLPQMNVGNEQEHLSVDCLEGNAGPFTPEQSGTPPEVMAPVRIVADKDLTANWRSSWDSGGHNMEQSEENCCLNDLAKNGVRHDIVGSSHKISAEQILMHTHKKKQILVKKRVGLTTVMDKQEGVGSDERSNEPLFEYNIGDTRDLEKNCPLNCFEKDGKISQMTLLSDFSQGRRDHLQVKKMGSRDDVASEEKSSETLFGYTTGDSQKNLPRNHAAKSGGNTQFAFLSDCSEARMQKSGSKRRGRSPEGGVENSVSDLRLPRVRVSLFDYSVANYLKAVDFLCFFCGSLEKETFDADEILRRTAGINFLEVWKDFRYGEKILRFAYENGSSQGDHYIDRVSMLQFSSATVTVVEGASDNSEFSNFSNDFILHVGGPVWALDWCPRVHKSHSRYIHFEYLAVSAHPPDASYHKVGEPLTGRGLIQIWCIPIIDAKGIKKWTHDHSGYVHLATSDILELQNSSRNHANGYSNEFAEIDHSSGLPCPENERMTDALTIKQRWVEESHGQGGVHVDFLKGSRLNCLPEGIMLPKLVLGLAHNGRVTWDAKWKPYSVMDLENHHRMGYLSVLLGSGSLEVWEVPSLNVVKTLYASHSKDGTDPRFLKLHPVFKCSRVKRGSHKSIPLTVEWSSSAPYDRLLAGFHDGSVAMWKFCPFVSGPVQDTQPLLCFTADNGPIRAVAWAPTDGDQECDNLVVTGGHHSLRFWDLRDPYRPIWNVNPVRRVVLSMHWLKDPGCILLAFDDGTLRILSLFKILNDSSLTGKSFNGSYKHCFQYYCFSTFSLWSIHASRLTGAVAYCSADGSAAYFQLPRKAVEKDAHRHRAPVFSCGSMSEEDSTLTLNTHLPVPLLARKLSEWREAQSTELKEVEQDTPAGTVPKPKSKGKKILSPSQAHVKDKAGVDEEIKQGSEVRSMEGKHKAELDAFPPKTIAMHRIRWNMNKGSERWLCYGGAAGIVRCQEVLMQAEKSTHARPCALSVDIHLRGLQ